MLASISIPSAEYNKFKVGQRLLGEEQCIPQASGNWPELLIDTLAQSYTNSSNVQEHVPSSEVVHTSHYGLWSQP